MWFWWVGFLTMLVTVWSSIYQRIAESDEQEDDPTSRGRRR